MLSSSSSSLSSLCLTLVLIAQTTLGQYVREPVPGYTFDEFVGDDLGVRFNKVVFIVPDVPPPGPNPLPFGPDDYPITLETAEWLRQTKAVSVFQQDDCFENDCNIDIQTLVLTIKHLLTYPSSNPNHFFWGEFYDVVLIQKKRLENEDPSKILALPHIWKDFDIHQVAEAVHDEVRKNRRTRALAPPLVTHTSLNCCVIVVAVSWFAPPESHYAFVGRGSPGGP